jgi:hypothetical protein
MVGMNPVLCACQVSPLPWNYIPNPFCLFVSFGLVWLGFRDKVQLPLNLLHSSGGLQLTILLPLLLECWDYKYVPLYLAYNLGLEPASIWQCWEVVEILGGKA